MAKHGRYQTVVSSIVVMMLALASAACANAPKSDAGATEPQPAAAARAAQVIADWPKTPKAIAQKLISKYGEPDGVMPDRLVWLKKGPWTEMVLSRDEIPHHFPIAHTDLLLQSIPFDVPADKHDELAAYDGSVIVERTKGTLAARCDKEEANFLALNLAVDVIRGKRTVEEARTFYATTAMALMKGEKPPYTQKLQFEVPTAATTGYADQPFMQVEAGGR